MQALFLQNAKISIGQHLVENRYKIKHSCIVNNQTNKASRQGDRKEGGGGPLWANRVSNENAKVSKKLRPIAQNSGHVARSLEHQFFLSIIENYIRYSALHQIFCVKVPSSGCILFHN